MLHDLQVLRATDPPGYELLALLPGFRLPDVAIKVTGPQSMFSCIVPFLCCLVQGKCPGSSTHAAAVARDRWWQELREELGEAGGWG